MRKILAVHEGAAIQIGNHGVATTDRPVLVPDDVAEELRRSNDGSLLIQATEGEPEMFEGVGPALPVGKERVEVLGDMLIEGDN